MDVITSDEMAIEILGIFAFQSYGSSEIKVTRGAKSSKKSGSVQYQSKRIEAARLKADGINNFQIAKQLDMRRMTVIRWFKGL